MAVRRHRVAAAVAVDWRTSSYTYGGGNCVEVAGDAGTVLVRDTKDPGGAILRFPAEAWRVFGGGILIPCE